MDTQRGMEKQIVILGAGTGGTIIANRLRRSLSSAQITVVDRDGRHVYQTGLFFVPFGLAKPNEIVRPRAPQLADGIHYLQCEIDAVDIEANEVTLADGTVLA